jgi:hypothetical protein
MKDNCLLYAGDAAFQTRLKALTTKDTKAHEGGTRASRFVILCGKFSPSPDWQRHPVDYKSTGEV